MTHDNQCNKCGGFVSPFELACLKCSPKQYKKLDVHIMKYIQGTKGWKVGSGRKPGSGRWQVKRK